MQAESTFKRKNRSAKDRAIRAKGPFQEGIWLPRD
jgi:hypothetical protein